MIDKQTIEDFLIRLYFNKRENYYKAGSNRAYLDFNRTLKLNGVDQTERNSQKNLTEDYLIIELKLLISITFDNQEQFDLKHLEITKNLKSKWNKLSIGHCQKWINMTLKYWIVFGEDKVNGINKNYKYFHIPIDSIVQKGIFKLLKNRKPWTQIESYKEYFEYQKKFRELKPEEIPLEFEFKFFNKS